MLWYSSIFIVVAQGIEARSAALHLLSGGVGLATAASPAPVTALSPSLPLPAPGLTLGSASPAVLSVV